MWTIWNSQVQESAWRYKICAHILSESRYVNHLKSHVRCEQDTLALRCGYTTCVICKSLVWKKHSSVQKHSPLTESSHIYFHHSICLNVCMTAAVLKNHLRENTWRESITPDDNGGSRNNNFFVTMEQLSCMYAYMYRHMYGWIY